MVRSGIAFLFVAGLAALAGCSDSPSTTGTVPEQLESLSVELPKDDGAAHKVSGTLAVTGADRAFQVSVAGSSPLAFDLHSPGQSPLAQLDGKTATVELSSPGMGGRSVIVTDDSGLLYVAALGDIAGKTAIEKEMGANVVKYGTTVGTQTDGTFVWTYKKAIFTADEGEVTLAPGDVATLHFDGVPWRAVVTASYEVSTNPDADELPGCAPESMLSYELLRIGEPPASPEVQLKRFTGSATAFVGCTAPPEVGSEDEAP